MFIYIIFILIKAIEIWKWDVNLFLYREKIDSIELQNGNFVRFCRFEMIWLQSPPMCLQKFRLDSEKSLDF